MLPSRSMRSSAMPQPRTTQVSGSSATSTGRPVSSASRRSRSRSSAPPPVSIMPRSAMSAPSSGGVCSSAFFTAETMWFSGSVSASRISLLRDGEAARHAFGQVAALDFDLLDFAAREGRADVLLDRFGGRLADQHAVVAADVVDDGFVELVAADAHAALVDHAAERDDADFGGAAADVDHHRAGRFATPAGRRRSPRPSAPRSGRPREAPAPSADSRIARRSTWVEPQGTQMMMRGLGLSTERGCTILMNCLSICSVTVKSAITPSFIGRMASMLPGTLPSIALASCADGLDRLLAVRAAFVADGDHRGLVEHDALAAHVDQRVGGAEVDGEVRREVATERSEHVGVSPVARDRLRR